MLKKITYEITCEDYESEHEVRQIVNYSAAYRLIDDVANDIFRPARKHGYSDVRITEACAACGVDAKGNSHAVELISLLEDKFYDLIREYNIERN